MDKIFVQNNSLSRDQELAN